MESPVGVQTTRKFPLYLPSAPRKREVCGERKQITPPFPERIDKQPEIVSSAVHPRTGTQRVIDLPAEFYFRLSKINERSRPRTRFTKCPQQTLDTEGCRGTLFQ